MPRNAPLGDSLLCARCGAENFAFASFCLACGEPLGDYSDGPEPSSAPASQSELQRPPGKPTPGIRSNRAASRWETWAGLLVLVLVVGYALYDWQRNTAQSDAYRAGAAAAQARDWDKAVSSFDRAGEHYDARQREDEGRKKVAERNRLYAEAVQASERHDWEAAISAWEEVQEIQPSYADSGARLAKTKDEALSYGLAGIAYLVGSGGPSAPGLYVRDALGRSLLLPGSDGRSTVHGVSPDGNTLVYDRPSSDTDYAPFQGATPQVPFEQGRAARIPVEASIGDSGVITTLPLPQLDSGGRGKCSDLGCEGLGEEEEAL